MPSRAGSLRSRRLLPALVAAAPLACAAPPAPPAPAGAWVDRDTPPSAGPEPSASSPHPEAPAVPRPWEHAALLPTLAAATPRARSQHFGGELEAEVRINPAAAGYPALGPLRRLPPGAVLVALHYAAGRVEPVALFAMVKHPPGYDPEAGDWEYLVLTPTGDATHRGRLPLCRRCHAEAPHDHLFGGPR